MATQRSDLSLVSPAGGYKSLLLLCAAGVPLFFIVHFIINAINSSNSVQVSFYITLYILACVLSGRYLSALWIKEAGRVRRSAFGGAAVVALACLLLTFFIVEDAQTSQRPYLKTLIFTVPFSIFFIALGVLIKFTRTAIQSQLVQAQVAAAQSKEEVRFLQTQLSPHFLFNTLNNMYGLSLTQHEKIPGLLLKLSDLLRYSVYDAKETYVPLQNELAYIKDYIDFEKIRIGDKLVLNTEFEENISADIKIAPLLLIVFIENAFKHAKNTIEQKIYIDIKLEIWANSILFYIKNSGNGGGSNSSIIKNSGGFGLENVMKRLQLLYGSAHDIKIENKLGFYTVMLQLKIR